MLDVGMGHGDEWVLMVLDAGEQASEDWGKG